MARPRKTGLDYFPFDCDFFEDEKIVSIAGEFGIKGELTAIKLLCAIYRNGYFIEWNEALKFKMLRQLPGVSADLFDQILNRLVRWGFFDASLFDSVKVLTSAGIQRRYFDVAKYRNELDGIPYLLLDKVKNYRVPKTSNKDTDEDVNGVFHCKTPVFHCKTPVFHAETPQIKGNKIKEEKPPYGGKKKEGVQGSLNLGKVKGRRGIRAADEFIAPTLEEVIEYFRNHTLSPSLKDWELTARQFFDHFNAVSWLDGSGRQITHWDSRANTWIRRQIENELKPTSKNENRAPDRFEQRRGVEPLPKSAKGFKGTL